MIDVYKELSGIKDFRALQLKPESPQILDINRAISASQYDFSTNHFFRYDSRLVTQYDMFSPENVIVRHLKRVVKKETRIRFSNRNVIIEQIIDSLQAARDLNDFTIIKFDFKQYFYSISTHFVYEKYLRKSNISRQDKQYLEELIRSNPYCVAGLSIFNYFVELVSRDLDKELKSSFATHGLFFYARYVDDGLIILNKCVTKKNATAIIDNVIERVFQNSTSKNKVSLNMSKFNVLNKRHLKATDDYEIDFLGYKITLKNGFTVVGRRPSLTIGMTAGKIDKYRSRIKKLIKAHYVPGNSQAEQTTRHIIKAHCSRVVYRSSSEKNAGTWISKGIISNYNKLSAYVDILDAPTKTFLNDIYKKAFMDLGYAVPGYLNSQRYSLYEGIMKNRAMIFNPIVGMSKAQLIKELNNIGDYSKTDSDEYDSILRWYLISVRVGY